MRFIYEFTDYTWAKWPNNLPLPVNNNTVVATDDHTICSDASEMDATEFMDKRTLKPDTSVHENNKAGRCGNHEWEVKGLTVWWSLKVGHEKLKDIICLTPYKRSVPYSVAKDSCKQVKNL